uniref:Sulfhydryl oxidase n=1 Tax=Salarias fasciatus TaxID=181472 RepID=A0A672H3I7_SALFA
MLRFWLWLAALWLGAGSVAAAGRLYTEEDPLVILSSSSLKPAVTNSSSAWIVQFYSSWCGHCIQYSGTWKSLAQDVRDWRPAVGVAVLDCAQEENYDVCKEFNIKFYPTFKYFRAHSSKSEKGTIYRGPDRGVQSVRQLLIDVLQNHTELDRPERCPPLRPHRSAELLPLLGQRSDHFTAVIVEEPESYVGREVILDLLQFSGVEVKRAVSSELPLLDALNITVLPSIYLLQPNGTHTHLHSEKPQRFFFSSLLRSLPGVARQSSSSVPVPVDVQQQSSEPWREFDRSLVYLADLESGLHYLLRVELASHSTLEGAELQVFKDFVTLVAKLYPGGGSVVKLMETLSDWLLTLPLPKIPYQAVLDLVDNKMRISGAYLGAELRWVGCQSSRAGLRGYPCSLWTLFHVLTVQHDARPDALDNTGLEADSAPVLQVMRRYIRTFFGCQECGRHFEAAAASGLKSVHNPEEQLLWLWQQHNAVNTRLAGSLSEDPLFPKAPWPSASVCPSCHEERNGVHVWNRDGVLLFLRRHYGAANLSPRYAATPPPAPRPAPPGAPPRSDRRDGGDGGDGGGRAGLWILGVGFNSVDMSLCVLLYVSSCLFLMLLFFFFRVRSRRWRLTRSRLLV